MIALSNSSAFCMSQTISWEKRNLLPHPCGVKAQSALVYICKDLLFLVPKCSGVLQKAMWFVQACPAKWRGRERLTSMMIWNTSSATSGEGWPFFGFTWLCINFTLQRCWACHIAQKNLSAYTIKEPYPQCQE